MNFFSKIINCFDKKDILFRSLRLFAPNLLWHKYRDEKIIYLTFDDGPIPEVTPWVLDLLTEYNIKATFFCIGDNIQKYPDVFNRIISDGHSVGNHTYDHIKGWETTDDVYLDNIRKCNELTKSSLFRPPYGEVSLSQIKKLRKNYTIAMWDVLTGDFINNLSPEKCLKNTLKRTKNGSIILFHDSLLAQRNLYYTLPKAIKHWISQGYSFGTLK